MVRDLRPNKEHNFDSHGKSVNRIQLMTHSLGKPYKKPIVKILQKLVNWCLCVSKLLILIFGSHLSTFGKVLVHLSSIIFLVLLT